MEDGAGLAYVIDVVLLSFVFFVLFNFVQCPCNVSDMIVVSP